MISLSGIYLKIAHFPVKIGLIGGVGGVPEIRFSSECSYFCYLGAHAKIQNLSCLLSDRKVKGSQRERKKERKIMPSTMVTTSSAQCRSDQNPLAPIRVLAPMSAHATIHKATHQHKQKFSDLVCRVHFKQL